VLSPVAVHIRNLLHFPAFLVVYLKPLVRVSSGVQNGSIDLTVKTRGCFTPYCTHKDTQYQTEDEPEFSTQMKEESHRAVT
jgi:hypothetical protein